MNFTNTVHRKVSGTRLVHAIVIASHDSAHTELTLAAIKAGKPVLCEKPVPSG